MPCHVIKLVKQAAESAPAVLVAKQTKQPEDEAVAVTFLKEVASIISCVGQLSVTKAELIQGAPYRCRLANCVAHPGPTLTLSSKAWPTQLIMDAVFLKKAQRLPNPAPDLFNTLSKSYPSIGSVQITARLFSWPTSGLRQTVGSILSI